MVHEGQEVECLFLIGLSIRVFLQNYIEQIYKDVKSGPSGVVFLRIAFYGIIKCLFY